MRQDPIWQAFALTGDPLYYLLYRAAENRRDAQTDDGKPRFQNAAVTD